MDATKVYCTLLVAVDGSAAARHASAHALYLARDLGAKLYVLYVIDTHHAQSLGIYLHEAIHEMRAEGSQAIDAVLQQAKDLSVGAEGILAEGRPGEEICRVAADRKVDIVVVGAKGRSAVEEVLLGSASEYVLHHAKQPVLVVRSRS